MLSARRDAGVSNKEVRDESVEAGGGIREKRKVNKKYENR
jgi:hypothetical protein